MIGLLARFFFGETRYLLKVPAHVGANLFLHSGIPCFKGTAIGQQGYVISIETGDKKKLERLLAGNGIDYEILYEKGALPFFFKAIKRPGLIVGLALALFLIFQSTNYVWDIRITGNDRLSDKQVLDILEEYGFFIGCRHSDIDLHEFCNILPMGRADIAWISVNMMGSVAEVQIIENRPTPEKDPPREGLVNLVAEREGQIVRYELSSGRAMVSVGQVVSKGQLLVAGFSEKDSGLHPKVSCGKVFAKVWMIEETFVRYTTLQKVEKEPVVLEKKINFLGKEIIFFKNSRFSEEKYDILEDEYRPTVFGISLPLPITVKYARPYEEQSVSLSVEQAKKLAQAQLMEKIRGVSDELLEQSFYFEENEKGVRAVLKVMCITDIAKTAKVTIEEEIDR